MSVRWAFSVGGAACRRLADDEQPVDDEVLYVGRFSDDLRWDEAAQTMRLPTDDEAAQAGKAAAVAAIKSEARRRILSRMPEWKQANATARAVELVAAGQTSGPEWAAMQAAWAWVKAVRAHSDRIELAVAQADDPSTVDIDQGWPE